MLWIQALLDGLSIGASYALLGAGVAVISSVLRFVSFSFGGQVVFVALVVAALAASLPLWLAILAGLVAGVLLSVATIPIAYRRAADMTPTNLVMISFALGLALQAGMVMLFSDTPRPFPAPEWLSGQMELGPFRISVASVVTIVIAILVLGALGLVLNRTRIGIAIRGAAEDPEVAQMLGVRPRAITIAAFALSGLISGVVAYLWYSKAGSVQPRDGLELSLNAFIAVVLGGLTSLRGSVVGGLVLGIATALLTTLLPDAASGFARVFLFALVIVLLLVRPEGLMGKAWEESR